MNSFDALLAGLARQLRELDPASQAEFFLQCGLALRPLYERWLDETGRPDRAGVLDTAALLVGERRSAANTSLDAEVILTSMEAEFPPGDALGDVSSTGAQSCWIAYDTALRLVIDASFAAEASVEYLLEPVTVGVSERLFGYSQIGSGPDEDRHMSALVADQQMAVAVDWISEVIKAMLRSAPIPDAGTHHPLIP